MHLGQGVAGGKLGCNPVGCCCQQSSADKSMRKVSQTNIIWLLKLSWVLTWLTWTWLSSALPSSFHFKELRNWSSTILDVSKTKLAKFTNENRTHLERGTAWDTWIWLPFGLLIVTFIFESGTKLKNLDIVAPPIYDICYLHRTVSGNILTDVQKTHFSAVHFNLSK